MSRLSGLVAARRPEEAVLAAPARDVAVTTTVPALTAPVVDGLQRRWARAGRASRPARKSRIRNGRPGANVVPSVANRMPSGGAS